MERPVGEHGPAATSGETTPGVTADTPLRIPLAGWRQILVRATRRNNADNVTVLAAGVAFFAFLALVPTLIAVVSIYGLVTDVREATSQLESLSSGLPGSVRFLVVEQLRSLAGARSGVLGLGFGLAVLVALWSASSAVHNLMAAVGVAYGETENRGILRFRGTALALTAGGIVAVVVTLGLVALAPVLLDPLPLGGRILGQLARWLLLAGLTVVGLVVVYRVGADRAAARLRWVVPGVAVATGACVAVSALFSLFLDNFGRYNETYGALAGVVALMLWMYLTSYLILLGAEINAESERQTARDTTRAAGDPKTRFTRRPRPRSHASEQCHGETPAGRDGCSGA